MNISLPQFTFLIGPAESFLAELVAAEPTAQVTQLDDMLVDACESLGIGAMILEVEQAARLLKPDFLGQAQLRDYKLYTPDAQVIFHHVRTRADVGPFYTEFGPRSCLIIRLGALLPDHEPGTHTAHTIWLPPMEAALQMKHLERELTKQIAPIEEAP